MITAKTKPVRSRKAKPVQSIDTKTSQSLMPLCEAIEKACGVRPSAQCAAKWSSRGVRGIKMPTVLIGGRRYAAIDDAKAFINKINGELVCSTPAESHNQ